MKLFSSPTTLRSRISTTGGSADVAVGSGLDGRAVGPGAGGGVPVSSGLGWAPAWAVLARGMGPAGVSVTVVWPSVACAVAEPQAMPAMPRTTRRSARRFMGGPPGRVEGSAPVFGAESSSGLPRVLMGARRAGPTVVRRARSLYTGSLASAQGDTPSGGRDNLMCRLVDPLLRSLQGSVCRFSLALAHGTPTAKRRGKHNSDPSGSCGPSPLPWVGNNRLG